MLNWLIYVAPSTLPSVYIGIINQLHCPSISHLGARYRCYHRYLCLIKRCKKMRQTLVIGLSGLFIGSLLLDEGITGALVEKHSHRLVQLPL